MNINGRTLELYFIDGKPDGMLTAKVFNWTGHILMTPRTQLKAALNRDEASYTGVYILLGEIEAEPTAYIGESEDIGARIKSHDSKKDWWDTAIFVTSSANNLHKAHVKYLESRLIDRARTISRISLDNTVSPSINSLSEADVSNMESFLDYLLMVLPALRIDMFLDKTRPKIQIEDINSNFELPLFELVNKKYGLVATAILDGSDFIVQSGSEARLEWHGGSSNKTSYWKLHKELCDQGILRIDGKKRVFTQNYAFSSTSAAGAVVNGRSSRGPTAWKLKCDGRTYQQWENDQLSDG